MHISEIWWHANSLLTRYTVGNCSVYSLFYFWLRDVPFEDIFASDYLHLHSMNCIHQNLERRGNNKIWTKYLSLIAYVFFFVFLLVQAGLFSYFTLSWMLLRCYLRRINFSLQLLFWWCGDNSMDVINCSKYKVKYGLQSFHDT